MNINDVLSGTLLSLSVEEQKEVLEKMKERKLFDLTDSERENLINFLCEKTESNLAIDYLFHVLDTEVSYPIDDEKIKKLFSDDRMKSMKDLMLEQLNTEETEEVAKEDDSDDD